KMQNTYNTRYSLIVTDSTTNPALTGLSMGERTGSRVLQWVWSYVFEFVVLVCYIVFTTTGLARAWYTNQQRLFNAYLEDATRGIHNYVEMETPMFSLFRFVIRKMHYISTISPHV
ncbi:hypothetical protein LZ31DRAFT_483178, partial [Colletotrichum somersetense]